MDRLEDYFKNQKELGLLILEKLSNISKLFVCCWSLKKISKNNSELCKNKKIRSGDKIFF